MNLLLLCSAKHIGDSVVAVRQAPESEQEVLLLGLRKKIIAGFGSISVPLWTFETEHDIVYIYIQRARVGVWKQGEN